MQVDAQETYLICNLRGFIDSYYGDGEGYFVVVERTSESGRLFAEITFMVGTAIAERYGENYTDVFPYLKRITFAKAKARIALNRYERGKQYIQKIYSEAIRPEEEPIPLDDRSVQRHLLAALRNIRQESPLDYRSSYIDVEGFCLILGITERQYLYNVSFLMEDGLIEESDVDDLSIKTGGMFITNNGIRHLQSIDSEMQIDDTGLATEISTLHDNINTIFRDRFEGPLLSIPQTRSIQELSRMCLQEEEFRYLVPALCGLAIAINADYIKTQIQVVPGMRPIDVLGRFLRGCFSNEKVNPIMDTFQNFNRLRRMYPTHVDHADGVQRAFGFFGLEFPIQDYQVAWTRLRTAYKEMLQLLIELLKS